MITKIRNLFESVKSVAIFFHVNPDGDAIGAAMALKYALEGLDIKVDIYSQDEISDTFNYISAQKIIKTKVETKKHDLGIIVDCPEIKRIGNMISVFNNCKKSMNIDHHLFNGNFADISLIDEKASSTCQIVFELFKNLKIEFNENIYKCLYTGISTDSGCFMFNLNPTIFKMTSEIVKHIDCTPINNANFREKSLNQYKLYAKGFSSIELSLNNYLATVVLTEQDLMLIGASIQDTDGLVFQLSGLKDAKVIALLCEEKKGQYKVSLRSKTEDVSIIAKAFGGGGHKFASGCKIYGTKNTVRNKLIDKVREISCTEF